VAFSGAGKSPRTGFLQGWQGSAMPQKGRRESNIGATVSKAA